MTEQHISFTDVGEAQRELARRQLDIRTRQGTRLDDVAEPDDDTRRLNELAEEARPLAETNPRFAAALRLLNSGRSVVPLDGGGRPLRGVPPSRDLAAVLVTWQKHPEAPAGSPCGAEHDLLGAALDEGAWQWLRKAATVERLSRAERIKQWIAGGPPPSVAEQVDALGVADADPAAKAAARRERRAAEAAVRDERGTGWDDEDGEDDEARFRPPEVRGHAGSGLWLAEVPTGPAAAQGPLTAADFYGAAAGRRTAQRLKADREQPRRNWLTWTWPQPVDGRVWTLPVGRHVRPGVRMLPAVPSEASELELDGTVWRVVSDALHGLLLPLPAWLAEALGGKLRPAPAKSDQT